MNLTVNQLRTLALVAEARSFTRAAEVLHVSQSAVSRSIAESERALGVQLFARDTRSVQPTEVGGTVAQLAADIVAEFQVGMARIDNATTSVPEGIRIAALPSVTATILPPVLVEFRRNYPATRIDVVAAHAASVSDLTADGSVDLGITDDGGLASALAFTELTADEFWCVFPPGHPFGRSTTVTWEQVASEPLVAFSTSSSVRSHTDHAFHQVGCSPISIIETTEIATAAGLVAAGLGVMVATALLRPLTTFADLRRARLVEPMVSRRIGIVRRRNASTSGATELLVRSIRKAFLAPL